MLNLLSLLIGFVGLLLAIPSFLPFLGWGNWLVVPIALLGLGFGVASRRTSGRNLNILVLIVAIARLSLGGGLI